MHTKIQCSLAIACGFMIRGGDPKCENLQGTVVRVSVVITIDATESSTRVLVGGKVVDESPVGGKVTRRQAIDYCDTILRIEKGQLRAAEREFTAVKDEYSESFSLASVPGTAESHVSALEGQRLRFEWNEANGAFDVSIRPEVEPRRELSRLQELVKPSFSAAFLCPSHEPSEGGEWEVPVSALRDLVLYPGGELFRLAGKYENPDDQFDADQRIAFWAALEGSIHAKLDPSSEETSTQTSVVIEGELSSELSLQFQEGFAAKRVSKETLKIAGRAIWDKENDRLLSIVIDGKGIDEWTDDIQVETQTGMIAGKGEFKLDIAQRWEFRCRYDPPAKAK